MTRCKCGRLARINNMCLICYQKDIEQNRISLELERKRLREERTAIEGHELEYNLKRFFRTLGVRPVKKPQTIEFVSIEKGTTKYVCGKCNKTRKTSRIFIDGKAYCKKCGEKVIDAKKAEELFKYSRAQGVLDEIDPFGEMQKECTKLGTCDILHFHHELLKDDPERLKTDFLIGMICGDEKLKKYKSKISNNNGG